MDLAQLRIFVAVVEEGGILKAARRLHRVPSNVTTRIQQLEAAVGAQLFYRDKQRLHLSPHGELLLAYAARLLRLADDAAQALAGSQPSGSLKLGALESTSASRLPGVLARYHRDFPNVRIELTTGTNDALVHAVLDRRLDAAFVAETPQHDALAALPLFAERLVLIACLGHRPVRGPRDVTDDSVLAFPNGCAYRRRLLRWLGDETAASLRTLELGSYHAMVACVGAGSGIALVPESVLDTMPLAPVRRHALPARYAKLRTPIIWRVREQTPALRALIDQLQAEAQRPGAPRSTPPMRK
jgi:DNA-binding transcriptional LysR family regulator